MSMKAGDSAGQAKAFSTPYDSWVARQSVPVVAGHYIEDLCTVGVAPWQHTGVPGAIIVHDGTQESNDCHILDLPPGGSTLPEAHLYEETVFVLSGRGATEIWHPGQKQQSFEWQAGSLFAVPLNVQHQFHNGSGEEPARLISVTSLPTVLNLFRNESFLYHCPFQFTDRFSPDSDDFSGKGDLDGMVWATNFVSDVRSFQLLDYKARGAGGKNVKLTLAGNKMGAHISEFPVGTYKKGHRHGPGAHVIILSGQGYSLMWKEGEPIKRYDWKPGTLIIPPGRHFHQHFNTGTTPARYLALRFTSNAGRGQGKKLGLSSISRRLGGDQIDYRDETPEVREMFESALRQSGAPNLMEQYYKAELDGVGLEPEGGE